jgi:FixJ family two-component response regulator
MIDERSVSPNEGVSVSLVGGDATVRHARQIMLRSENYEVRSYATYAALLADPRSRDCSCIILDVAGDDVDGLALLAAMRATGWRGKAIVLDGAEPGITLGDNAERHGDRIFARQVGDRTLITAIEASVDRSWSSWNARG